MKDLKYLFFSLALFLSACGGETGGADPTHTIVYDEARVKDFAELMTDRGIREEYVLLRSDDGATDFSRIEKAIVRGDRIYLQATRGRERDLFVFGRDGRGIGQVGRRGQGPREYLQVTDFDVTPSGDIYFLDGQRDRLFRYDADLAYIDDRPFTYDASTIQAVDGGFLFGLTAWNELDYAGVEVIRTDTALNVVDTSLAYDGLFDNAYWISGYIFIRTADGISYNQPIDNRVYLFDSSGTLRDSLEFDFGSRNVPDAYKTDVERNLPEFERLCALRDYVAVTPRYIQGAFLKGRKTVPFVYDRRSNTFYEAAEQEEYANPMLIGYSDTLSIAYYEPGMDTSALPDSVQAFLEKEDFVLCLRNIY